MSCDMVRAWRPGPLLTGDAASARRVQSVESSSMPTTPGFAVSMSQVLGPDNPDITHLRVHTTPSRLTRARQSKYRLTDAKETWVLRPGPPGARCAGRSPCNCLRPIGITGVKVIPVQTAVALGTVSTITGNLGTFGVSVQGSSLRTSLSATIEQRSPTASERFVDRHAWMLGTLGLTHTSGTTLREEIQWG